MSKKVIEEKLLREMAQGQEVPLLFLPKPKSLKLSKD